VLDEVNPAADLGCCGCLREDETVSGRCKKPWCRVECEHQRSVGGDAHRPGKRCGAVLEGQSRREARNQKELVDGDDLAGYASDQRLVGGSVKFIAVDERFIDLQSEGLKS
jgi:hypothetical protein